MMKALYAAVLSVLVVPVAFAQDSPAARGDKLFTVQKCTICHAVADVGNKKGPMDDIGSRLSAEEMRQWITRAPEMAAKINAQRKPAMKPFTNLTPAEVDDLVAYLQTLKKK